jgi:hypothetical protein
MAVCREAGDHTKLVTLPAGSVLVVATNTLQSDWWMRNGRIKLFRYSFRISKRGPV